MLAFLEPSAIIEKIITAHREVKMERKLIADFVKENLNVIMRNVVGHNPFADNFQVFYFWCNR